MQTRRDQLQAYRFQTRRAVAALVAGRPNVIEPPMRRLTVTTISGIMIAILIAVGFALLGLLKPSSGDSWRQPGSILVENETGARFVLLGKTLHPVLNYPSAVLALAGSQTPQVVHVDRSTLDGVRRGATIGIPQLPDSFPGSSELLSGPWTVCSRVTPAPSGASFTAVVSVLAGAQPHAQPLGADSPVYVSAAGSSATYLLYAGQRLAVTPAVRKTLNLSVAPLSVGRAFLDAVPAGAPLRAPQHVPGLGTASRAVSLPSGRPVVGQLLRTGPDQYSVVLNDGIATVTPVEAALLETLPIGAGHTQLAPEQVSTATTVRLPTSTRAWPTVVEPQFAGLPNQLPQLASQPGTTGGICAVYRSGAPAPTFTVPPSLLPSFAAGNTATAGESAADALGRADRITVPAGYGAVLRSSDGSHLVYVVTDAGQKYAAASAALLTGFGYAGVRPVVLPSEVLDLLPAGPALNPVAARRPVPGGS